MDDRTFWKKQIVDKKLVNENVMGAVGGANMDLRIDEVLRDLESVQDLVSG